MSAEPGLLRLEPEVCWQLLRSQRVGRIAFSDRAMPAIRPLNYCVDGNHLVLQVGRQLAVRLDGQVVAFEVDELDADLGTGCSVVITGMAALVTDPEEALRIRALAPSWLDAADRAAVHLTVGVMEGRQLQPRTEASA